MNFPYKIVGVRHAEGGRRTSALCTAFDKKTGDLKSFQPLVEATDDWENYFIEKYGIKLPSVYYPPYNFKRTGCKGCPFNVNIQQSLDILQQFFPAERKQCEAIWAPVYSEYRRLGYRMKKEAKK